MGQTTSDPLRDAYSIVSAKARAYAYRDIYPQIVVFTTFLTETDLLQQEFGGHKYKHGSGWVWLLSRQEGIDALMEKMKDHFPSDTGFEDVIVSIQATEDPV